MDRAIAQVMDIFPSHSLEHVRRCLEHPSMDGDPAKLISSLLEGTLPAELAEKEETPQGIVPPAEDFKYVKDRRNAWDEDIMDFSRLRIGKTRFVDLFLIVKAPLLITSTYLKVTTPTPSFMIGLSLSK
jgi:activating signal cointegrator complex subunit 2